jgi:hypothetical protein
MLWYCCATSPSVPLYHMFQPVPAARFPAPLAAAIIYYYLLSAAPSYPPSRATEHEMAGRCAAYHMMNN